MFISPLIDFLIPRLCLACGRKLGTAEDTVCNDCLPKLKYADAERIKSEYDRKFLPKGYIFDFASLYVFERNKELQNIIHQLKYANKFKAGVFLGRMTAEHYTELILKWDIDLVVPVPLHRMKTISRGYNQSRYIAEGVNNVLRKTLLFKGVVRQKNTLTQTKMNLKDREENMREAFRVKDLNMVKNKTVLLVDDVITTGSTINECARVLLKASAKKVCALSPAIAELNEN